MENERYFLNHESQNVGFSGQYLATLIGNLVAICAGMHAAWPSPSLPQLLDDNTIVRLTSSQGSWLAVMPCLGAPLGAIFCALMVDRIGRKTCILVSSPLYLTAWLAIAYARSLSVLLLARLIAGIADGIMFTVFPMYISEISQHSIRGFLGSSITIAFTIGTLAVNCLGLYFSIHTTALIGLVFPILHIITFIWMPESGVYLTERNRRREIDECVAMLINSQLSTKCSNWKLLELFTIKVNRKALWISISLRFLQQFSGNFVILFYCLFIFNEAGGAISGSSATIIYCCIQLISSTLSAMLMDKAGRRPLLMVSTLGSGCMLAVQGVYFYLKNETHVDINSLGFMPLCALVLYNIFFNLGLSSIPTLMLSELFSPYIKAVALCVCDIFFASAVLLAAKFFQIFNDEFGMHVPFFAFVICCVIGLVFIVFCLPETKGKTLEQIQFDLHT